MSMNLLKSVLCWFLLQNYIARFGHGSAKLARQAQSKEKTLAKMVAQGLTEKVTNDKIVTFYFPSCGTIPPPVIMVQVSWLTWVCCAESIQKKGVYKSEKKPVLLNK